MNKKVSLLLLSSLLGSSLLNAGGPEVVSAPQAPTSKALSWGQRAAAAAVNQVEAHPYVTGALEVAGATAAGAGVGYGLYKQHQALKGKPYWMAGVYTVEAAALIASLIYAYKKGCLTREQLANGLKYVWETKGADFCKTGARTIGDVSCWIGRNVFKAGYNKAYNFFTSPAVEGAVVGAVAKEVTLKAIEVAPNLYEATPSVAAVKGAAAAMSNAVAQKASSMFSFGHKPETAAAPQVETTTRNELEAQRTVLLWRIDVLKSQNADSQLIATKIARLAAIEEQLEKLS